MKVFCIDRGRESFASEFITFFVEKGIRRDLTTPYPPDQKGGVDRTNITVVEMERNPLKAKGKTAYF